MSIADRHRWDARWRDYPRSPDVGAVPAALARAVDHLPGSGRVLEIACGRGEAAVWLAVRGFEVLAVDVSPVAVEAARDLAHHHGVSHRCRFDVHDLDIGLPVGPQVDLVVCHRFRAPNLNTPLLERMAPRGLIAITVLSEVGAEPSRFRARPGELHDAFAELTVVEAGEADGEAWLIGRRSDRASPPRRVSPGSGAII